MEEQNILAEISRLRAEISGYQSQIQAIQSDINSLNDIHGGFCRCEKNFQEMQEEKVEIADRMNINSPLPQLGYAISGNMKDRLRGRDYYDVYDGFQDAKRKIGMEISRKQERIANLNYRIALCNMEINSLGRS